ncbi:hypothetical protein ACSSS7_000408 [Eimeria intestinalis]
MEDCAADSEGEEEGFDGSLAQTRKAKSAANKCREIPASPAPHGNNNNNSGSSSNRSSRSRSRSRSLSRSRSADRVVLSSNESLSPTSSEDDSDAATLFTSSSSSSNTTSSNSTSDGVCWLRLNRGFFSVYLLQSVSSPLHFYVGCTTNPPRRLRQHNGELQQGARRTLSHRPWRLCLVLWGFPSLVSALQFEFRWQQGLVPAASFRALCCSSQSGAVCCCSSCSSCSARRRQRRQLQGPRSAPAKSRKPPTQPTGRQAEATAPTKSTAAGAEASAAARAAGRAAAAAAAQWEMLELQAAAADDSRCCRAPFVYTRRRSKDALQRLEAELQQVLLLLHGPPFCRLPLHLHACATDVAEVFEDLLLYPCCGGGARRHYSSSSSSSSNSSGRALTRLPEQITVSSGPVESIASIQSQALQQVRAKCAAVPNSSSSSSSGCTCCFGGRGWPGRPHVTKEANGFPNLSPATASPTAASPAALKAESAAVPLAVTAEAASTETCPAAAGTAEFAAPAAAPCRLCACPFLEGQRALVCPQCGVYVHLTCAGRFSLQQEAAARAQQQQQHQGATAAAGATAAPSVCGPWAPENDSETFPLLPLCWWCWCCSRRVFWCFVLNHLFIRGPQGVPAKRARETAETAEFSAAADYAAPTTAEAAAFAAAASDREPVLQQLSMRERGGAKQTPAYDVDAFSVTAQAAAPAPAAAAAAPAAAAPAAADFYAGREQALLARRPALARTGSEPASLECSSNSALPLPSDTDLSYSSTGSSNGSSVPPLLERLRLRSHLSGNAPD